MEDHDVEENPDECDEEPRQLDQQHYGMQQEEGNRGKSGKKVQRSDFQENCVKDKLRKNPKKVNQLQSVIVIVRLGLFQQRQSL